MKSLFFSIAILILIFSLSNSNGQGVAINEAGTTAHASAMLDVQSTSKGVLIPKMNTAQRNAISSPAVGLLVFDTDTESFWFRGSSAWIELSDATSNPWQTSGSNIYYNTGNVGIGDSSPTADLTVGNGDKFKVDGTRGDVTFADDSASIKFAATTGANRPMILMFASGTQNSDRMVLAHSSLFPTWGIEYDDTIDVFHFRSATSRKFSFELSSGDLGIGLENPNYPLDLVGRMRIRSDGTGSNRPGIWFSNQTNTFDRALLGMSEPDSTLGIWSQHLGKWAIEFEVMREPRIGINIPPGSPPRAELHVVHTDGGGSNDGVRIQNEGTNGHYWNLYTSDATGDFEFYDNGIVEARIANGTGVYSAVSDENAKTGIKPMEDVIPKILLLEVKRYHFKNDPTMRNHYGLVAQELEKVFPENVYSEGDEASNGFYTVDYASLSVVALKAIQEQQTQIEALKAEIEALKVLVSSQRSAVSGQ